MTTDYPVRVEVSSPPRYDRVQLALRIGLAIVLGWIGITMGWLIFMLYATLPLIAAFGVSSAGSEGFQNAVAPRVWRVLRWLLQLSAYMLMLVDRFPTGEDSDVRIDIRYTGRPTTSSGLMRLLSSIPSGLVLFVVWFGSAVLWMISALIVLLGGSVPSSILAFQRGRLRWEARLVAYHASLVDEYPPFSFDTGDHHDSTLAASGAR